MTFPVKHDPFSFFNILVADAEPTYFAAAEAWADGAVALTSNILDCPRVIVATLTDVDNSCTGVVTFDGFDMYGRPVQEVMTVTADPGTRVFVGTKIFSYLASATISSAAGAGVGDALAIGTNLTIGLPDVPATANVVWVSFNGDMVAGPTLTAGVNTSTFTPAAHPGTDSMLTVCYRK